MRSYLDIWKKVFGPKPARRIFIAATRQNVGKTTVSLGLIASMKKRFNEIGFIKPVGQRYLIEDGHKVDEDAVLMDRIFGFNQPLEDMSPVAVERGYTEKFLDGSPIHDASSQIRDAFSRIMESKDIVIIEGTGHAGVGSVFDLSNATVAKLLSSKVILVSSGGIGNPIDEIMLNKSLFDNSGVELAGVIVNKVRMKKYDKINKYIRKGLARKGVPVLGVVPYVELLDMPTMWDIKDELGMHILCGEDYLGMHIKKVLVGAMEVKDALPYFEDDCVVITPGDRLDLINLAVNIHKGKGGYKKRIAGVILSGGQAPSPRVYRALKNSNIPTLVTYHDTYRVTSQVHDLTVKIKSRDKAKVDIAMDLIERYVDMDAVMRILG